jgi:hypothetical protein
MGLIPSVVQTWGRVSLLEVPGLVVFMGSLPIDDHLSNHPRLPGSNDQECLSRSSTRQFGLLLAIG